MILLFSHVFNDSLANLYKKLPLQGNNVHCKPELHDI